MPQPQQDTLLTTPVLFLVFNRPDMTKRVFGAIRQAKPKQLFIVADGPRADYKGDVEKCRRVRELVAEIDWPCEVKKIIREKNLGCRNNVSSAINWFFENVDEGIILEDDCLPSRSFFRFCQDLLHKYRHNRDVMHIGGFNHFGEILKKSSGYHFTKYTPVWGWATWKRAWKLYDVQIKSFPDVKRKNRISDMFTIRAEQKFRLNLFEQLYHNRIDTWDYQWNYAVRLNDGNSIRPNRSLVENIGFTKEATHTTKNSYCLENVTASDIAFPLDHPEVIAVDEELDRKFYYTFIKPTLFSELMHKFKILLKK